MSDYSDSSPGLASEVRELAAALRSLTLRVAHLENQLLPESSERGWELVGEETVVAGALDPSQISSGSGPPRIPAALLDFARTLSDAFPGRVARAETAFRLGFFAQRAVVTGGSFDSEPPRGPVFSQWIVLRCKARSNAVRLTKKADLLRLLDPPFVSESPADLPVYQGFASITELRIFCAGAGIAEPPLLRWTGHQ
eukprot:Skav212495  [mRNA]  locus=scaffold2060:26812:27402:- [translate_table: standard]